MSSHFSVPCEKLEKEGTVTCSECASEVNVTSEDLMCPVKKLDRKIDLYSN
ncbi:MAG: hypothetical protein GWO11_00995 [Desulfuromonadales bacterium]|nr:hypothetical protein [Desulfuromonadales bacterium]NIR33086.1 hypothetical protein [Desulfuromonadales bacterium]NIS39324.1 hypothetical protein [Desulfuromonadales bacterium]